MASLAYHKFLETALKGDLDFDTAVFKVALVTSAYVEDVDHDFFDDITNEVTGTGYTAGGNTVTVTVTRDTANNRIDISLGGTTWPTATITAAGAVYYVERAGAASTDDLVAFNDFGGNVTSTADTFTLAASTLRFAF
jgi:CRISPR/Cas system CMR-associated protein Cmr3 (group 5 of RAMP superfamily)